MGAVNNKECLKELKKQLEIQKTGKIIKLNWREKDTFSDSLKQQDLKPSQMNYLYPRGQKVVESTGFMYKPDCIFYEGGIKNSKMEGDGRLTVLNKAMALEYEGEFVSNQFCGKNNTLLLKQYSVVLRGNWETGMPKKVIYQDRNRKYQIDFKQVQLHDLSKMKVQIDYPDQRTYLGYVTYDKDLKRYVVTGRGIMVMRERGMKFCEFEGDFIKGKLNGQGRMTKMDAGEYIGQFKNGLLHGKGTFQYQNGDELEVEWKNNKPDGKGKIKKYVNCQKVEEEVEFKEGVLVEV